MESENETGVDALEALRAVMDNNRDAVMAERLNATSKMVVDMAISIAHRSTRKDGILRTVDAIRQLFKLVIAIDGADADRKLAEVMKELEELKRVRGKTRTLQ